MASKNTTQVLIGGKIYTMSGYESEEYLQRVAAYLNNKITEIKAAEGYARMSQEMRSLLLTLNTADDYFKLKEKSDQLCESISGKDKELYEIKHELISTQMKLESVTRELETEKEAQLEAQQELTELRTRLEDVRSGLGAVNSRMQTQAVPEGVQSDSVKEAPLQAAGEQVMAKEPEQPARAEEAKEPEQPAGSEEAKEPEQPAGSEEAKEPGQPVETVEAKEPGQPVETVEAKEPGQTREGDFVGAEPAEQGKDPEPAEHANRKQKYNRYYRR